MSREREKIPVRRDEQRVKDVKQMAMVIDHAYLSGGPYMGCFRCGRSLQEHVA